MKPEKTVELMLEIIKAGKPVAVTQRVNGELNNSPASMGMRVRPDLPAEKPKDGDGMCLACITLEPGEEPVLPDNKICQCGWGCGRTVQHRPNHPGWLTKVCLQCLADRPLHGHG